MLINYWCLNLASILADGNTTQVKFIATNKEITLACSFGEVANKMRWYLRRNLEKEEHFVYDLNLRVVPGYFPNCSLVGQYCNIRIINATKEMAGVYSFEYGLNGRDGKIACQYEVVVGGCQNYIWLLVNFSNFLK